MQLYNIVYLSVEVQREAYISGMYLGGFGAPAPRGHQRGAKKEEEAEVKGKNEGKNLGKEREKKEKKERMGTIEKIR